MVQSLVPLEPWACPSNVIYCAPSKVIRSTPEPGSPDTTGVIPVFGLKVIVLVADAPEILLIVIADSLYVSSSR